MKLMGRVLLLLISIHVLGKATSQSNQDELIRESVVKKYLANTSIVADLRSNARVNTEYQLQGIMPILRRLGSTFPKLVKTVIQEIDAETIVARSIAETFTDEEIEALYVFVNTPEGKSVARRATIYSQYLDRDRIWHSLTYAERVAVRSFSATKLGKSIERKYDKLQENVLRNFLEQLKNESLMIILDVSKRTDH